MNLGRTLEAAPEAETVEECGYLAAFLYNPQAPLQKCTAHREWSPHRAIINPENARQTFLPADLIEAILQVEVSFPKRLQFVSSDEN